MTEENLFEDYLPIGISLIALVISAIGLILNIRKYKFDKSLLKTEIKKIKMASLTAMYPSMEDNNSPYELEIQIFNSGYRKEFIKKIRFTFQNSQQESEVNKIIEAKSQDFFDFEFKRSEILQLKKITIIPAVDRIVNINKKEISNWQKEIINHIQDLKSRWKDGRKIK